MKIIYQQDEKDCGVTCIAMVSAVGFRLL
ncbi:cysteine peptidase family C39 domain-containing protein [Lactococcus lactis]